MNRHCMIGLPGVPDCSDGGHSEPGPELRDVDVGRPARPTIWVVSQEDTSSPGGGEAGQVLPGGQHPINDGGGVGAVEESMGKVLRVVGSVACRGGAVGSFWTEHRGILSDMGRGGLADVTEESIAAEGSVEKAPAGDEEGAVDGFVGKAEPWFIKTGTQG